MPARTDPRPTLARRASCLLLALAIASVSQAAEPGPSPPVQRKPDVIVYLIDTLRADHLGTYGYERDTSPALDRFAEEAVVFENAYAQSSWTKASVGALFTGLLPSRHGAVRRDQRLRDDATTLAEHLSAAGYRTVAFVSNPNVLPVFGFGQGFDDVFDVDSVMLKGTADRVHAAIYEYLDARAPETDEDRAPLFLYVHTRDPHAPYKPPKEFENRFPPALKGDPLRRVLSLYDGEIAFADAEIGRLFERLKRHDLYEDALIMVLSDHGEEFGDHGSSGHGHTLFEEQLRVPLIVRLPGRQRAGTRVKAPVRVVDVLPTVSDLLDIETPDGIDGISFRNSLRGTRGTTYDPTLFSELDLDGRAVRSLYRPPYKLIVQTLPRAEAGEWLYDLSADARERRNIASAKAPVVDALKQEIATLDAAASGGTYATFTNASALDAKHEIRGTLRAIDGTFSEIRSGSLEDGDVARLTPSGDAIELTLSLRNEPHPTGQNPPVIVDLDDVRFVLDPPDARLRIDLEVDGAPLETRDLLIGAGDAVTESMTVSPRAPSATLESPALAQTPDRPRPTVRIYTVPMASTTATVDPALDARLRALGYLGEDEADEPQRAEGMGFEPAARRPGAHPN